MERKNDEIWRRIDQIMQYFCDGNNIEFAIKLNKEPSYTSQICNGTKSAGKKILDLILSTFPQVSRTWLILGEGQMLSTSSPAGEPTANPQRSNSEPTLLQLYTEAIRENERLRMEVERLREKIALLSAETSEVVTLPSDTI